MVRDFLERFEEQLTNSLDRLNFIYRNEKISTECIKSYKGISILGESFGPYEKGKKYKLQLFSAIPFIENDVLKVEQEDKYDNIAVQRYAIAERDDQMLVKRDNRQFLNKLKEFKRFMEYDIKKNLKPNIDLDRYNSYTSNIIDSRLLKLLKIARAELSLNDERRLTNSEKLLYKLLFKLIKEWRQFFFSIK